MIAGALQIGRKNVGRTCVDKRSAVFGRHVVIRIPPRPVEQSDCNSSGVSIIASRRTAAAVEISRREFVEVAAKLAQFVIINQRENERFRCRASRAQVIGCINRLATENCHCLGQRSVTAVGKNCSARRAGNLVRIGRAPGPAAIAGDDRRCETVSIVARRLMRNEIIRVLDFGECAENRACATPAARDGENWMRRFLRIEECWRRKRQQRHTKKLEVAAGLVPHTQLFVSPR